MPRAIITLASQYGRYGYRRMTVLLQRAGWQVGKDRVQRIWRREGLKVPQKQKPRGRLWLNDGACVRLRPEGANHVWSYDFVSGSPLVFRLLSFSLIESPHRFFCSAEVTGVWRKMGIGQAAFFPMEENVPRAWGQRVARDAAVAGIEGAAEAAGRGFVSGSSRAMRAGQEKRALRGAPWASSPGHGRGRLLFRASKAK